MLLIVVVLLILWALGLLAHVGALINILLIIALVVFILDHTNSRRL